MKVDEKVPTSWFLKYEEWEIEGGRSPDSRKVQTYERKMPGRCYSEARKAANEFMKRTKALFDDDFHSVVSPEQRTRREYRELYLAGIYDKS